MIVKGWWGTDVLCNKIAISRWSFRITRRETRLKYGAGQLWFGQIYAVHLYLRLQKPVLSNPTDVCYHAMATSGSTEGVSNSNLSANRFSVVKSSLEIVNMIEGANNTIKRSVSTIKRPTHRKCRLSSFATSPPWDRIRTWLEFEMGGGTIGRSKWRNFVPFVMSIITNFKITTVKYNFFFAEIYNHTQTYLISIHHEQEWIIFFFVRNSQMANKSSTARMLIKSIY